MLNKVEVLYPVTIVIWIYIINKIKGLLIVCFLQSAAKGCQF